MSRELSRRIGVSFVLVLVVTMGTSQALAGLTAHYTFDDGTASDSSGNEFHGTLVGDATVVADDELVLGGSSNVLELDGDGDQMDVPPLIHMGEEVMVLTIAMWIKPDQSSLAEGNHYLFAHTANPWTGGAMHLQLQHGFLRCRINGEPKEDASGLTLLEADRWYHIAVVRDGTDMTFYIDGQVDGGQPMSRTVLFGDGFFLGAWDQLDVTTRRFTGRIDDVRVYDTPLTQGEIQDVMAEIQDVRKDTATAPWPGDGAIDVPRDVVLSWTPADSVEVLSPRHRILFSDRFEDVNDATAVAATQDATSYDPGRLDFGSTYYWRVDEADDVTVWSPGRIWQFTVESVAYPVASERITATASSSNSAQEGPENTINGSGLGAGDLHSDESQDMWLSGSEPVGAWIEYAFDKAHKLHEMWVWNFNREGLDTVYGFKDVTVEYSIDGETYNPLGMYEFEEAPGISGYAHKTAVPFDGVVAKYVRISANSNWSGGIVDQYGLSEVRFFHIPVWATVPDPDSGATEVSIGTIDQPADVTLHFKAGREAVEHNVYFDTDEQAVIDGTAGVTTVTEASYGPLPLDLGETYYWRVDEVNEAEIPATWAGDVWDFTTQGFYVVDDFESYTNDSPNRVFQAWTDGLGFSPDEYFPNGRAGNGSGAIVGYDPSQGDIMEKTIVHGGKQAMPLAYNNSDAGYSEATMTLVSGRDWTVRGVGVLSLWFQGHPAVGSFAETPAGTCIMTAAGADIWGTSDEFHFAYKELTGAGSIVAKIDSVKNTHHWAKVGVMVRDTLEPDSAHAMAAVTPGSGVNFVRRNAAGVETNTTQETGITAPVWVKIECGASGYCMASYSLDGSVWTELGAKTIVMQAPLYAGLALTAHSSDETGEAEFSGVQVSGTVSPEWQNQDIGILSNDPEPMYVTLADRGGAVAAVYNEDPNATQAGKWTEWSVDLQRFSDEGVDLSDVDKLSIGFGNGDDPQQPGGSGEMFLDDIRLVPRPELEPSALQLHYTFDDGTAQDSSGNELHGTLVGDATVVADDELVLRGSPNVLELDGDGDQVDIPPLGEEAATLTIAMWIKPEESSLAQGNHYLFAHTANPWVPGALHLQLQHGFLRCRINGEPKQGASGLTLLEADRWYHIAVVRNGTDMIFYVDGQPDGGQPMSRTVLMGDGFFLGAWNQIDVAAQRYAGRIDDVQVYDTALTQAEIQELIN